MTISTFHIVRTMSSLKIEYREVPGRGIGGIATQPLNAGEIVVSELPLILYPQSSAVPFVCSYCLRHLSVQGISPFNCESCGHAQFCSPNCAAAAAADPASHNELVCKVQMAVASHHLTLSKKLTDEQETALLYLIRACSLIVSSRSGGGAKGDAAGRLRQILSLSSRGSLPMPEKDREVIEREAVMFHNILTNAFRSLGLDPDFISATDVFTLLEKDAINGYGVLFARSTPDASGCSQDFGRKQEEYIEERRLRGTGLYANASRINHECLPNATRFDRFDATPTDTVGEAPGSNTMLQIRMLHDLPAGEEVTQSYFPLTWSYMERQTRCRDHYGFECACPRCREEMKWPIEDGGGGADDDAKHTSADGAAVDASYIDVFVMKFVCPHEGCQGTMAPIMPGVPQSAQVLECSVCGRFRSEEEFMKDIERFLQSDMDE